MSTQRRVLDVREIYFVQGFELKLIKIGVTNDTRRRMVSMQTFSPDRLVVLGVQICLRGGALEKTLHRKFDRYRQHGEWFMPAPELLAHIAENTVALDDVTAARAAAAVEDRAVARMKARLDRRKEDWMRANGFAHLLEPLGDYPLTKDD